MTRPTRSILRAGAAVGVMVAFLALATPAFAHVEAEGETAPDGLTTVTFSFSHGCSPSPTTSLKVKLPAGTSDVQAESPTGWTSSVDDAQITWTGGSIPDTTPGSFTATMRVIGTKGDTIFLPTVQGCAQGENAWIELTADPEADNAAPRIVLAETVAASATSTPTTATNGTQTTSSVEASDAKIVHDSENSPIGVVVIVIVVAVIVGGGVILYLRNRRPSAP